MKLSAFCIKRPIFTIVINVLIILIGVVSYQALTVREFPNISIPVVSVSTGYAGASSEIIENQITRPLEDALSGIEGIDHMTSKSKDERSQITLVFKSNRDIEAATNDIRDRVSRTKGLLPDDADDSIIAKADADGNVLIWLTLYSDKHSLMDISEYVERNVKDKLEVVPGVSRVVIVGNREPSMRVWLDNLKLSAYDLTVQDVVSALRQQNVEIPTGRVEGKMREFTVYAKTDLRSVEEFKNVILSEKNQYLVKLKDVANVDLAPVSERFHVRYNNKTSVGIGIVKQSTANPLDISKSLNQVVPEIQDNLLEGMSLKIAYDSTKSIKQSIHAVYKTIFEALILVVLVIFLFLRTIRATLIPIVTIPIALIGGFALMLMLNFSINTLTLLAMVLAIGLVVDDAIVVLENIYRHMEEGLTAMQAALKGAEEIGTAVVAMTLTLVAVFAPVAFSEGEVGKLFTEFAIVLAGTVLISGFAALTLSPMMCAHTLKLQHSQNRFFSLIEKGLDAVYVGYQWALKHCMTYRKTVCVGLVIIFASNIFLLNNLKSEMVPTEDRGFVITFGMAPLGSTIEYTDKYARDIAEVLSADENIRSYFLVVGYPTVNQAVAFSLLAPKEKRELSQQEIVQQLGPKIYEIPGLMAFPINPPSSIGGGGFRGQIGFVVKRPGSYGELKQVVDDIMEKARQNPKIMNLDSDLKLDKPQIRLTVDRDKAASMGVDAAQIGHTLQILFGGQTVTHYKKDSKQYDVILKAEDQFRQTPGSLSSVMVKSQSGQMVQLANFIMHEEVIVPSELNHFDKMPAAIITGTISEDYSLPEALDYLNDIAKEVNISGNVQIDYSGASRSYMESSNVLFKTFILALMVIFLVLAAQFESFINPLVIMVSVPLAIAGALLTINLTGGSMNIFSQIGLITLIGLITKHGILIVEFANQEVAKGIDVIEAASKAALLRFRPILMTTAATILGALPLAIASGSGSEGRQAIGWAIVGGMLLGTVFTLLVVPVIYSYLAGLRKNGSDRTPV